MSQPHLLITEPQDYAQEALDKLKAVFQIHLGPLTREELLKKAPDIHGVLIRLSHRIDQEFIEKAHQLQFIASPTTGLNHIDTKTANIKKIAVLSLKNEVDFLNNIHATAEHCWGLILSLLRHIPNAHYDVSQGKWDRDRFKGRELHGKTIGLVGCGRLGRKIAAYGKAFGMRVIAHDPHLENCENFEFCSLEKIAQQADIISIHAAYNISTHNLINDSFFKMMKKEALFINTARGEIVNEVALIKALKNKTIAGAAVDVLCGENTMEKIEFSAFIQDCIRECGNLIITPHIGGATYESMAKTEIFITDRILHFMIQQK